MGQKQKTERKERKTEMANLSMAQASTHGTRKPPGPTYLYIRLELAIIQIQIGSIV